MDLNVVRAPKDRSALQARPPLLHVLLAHTPMSPIRATTILLTHGVKALVRFVRLVSAALRILTTLSLVLPVPCLGTWNRPALLAQLATIAPIQK